jgi:hypothetical protein
MMAGEWFVIPSGDRDGRAHLAGWKHSAIKLVDDGSHEYERRHGYMKIAHCPRCSALVLADDKDAYGDLTWAHEQWHAATDYPIPPDVLAKVTRP